MIKINTVGHIIDVIYFFFFSKDAYKQQKYFQKSFNQIK